jgi:hypothetical protein
MASGFGQIERRIIKWPGAACFCVGSSDILSKAFGQAPTIVTGKSGKTNPNLRRRRGKRPVKFAQIARIAGETAEIS